MGVTGHEDEWYEDQVVGRDPLNNAMKKLSQNAALSKIYTNHCIRASVVSKLDKDGFESRHIMVVSSHKSENSIKSYASKCPESKKKEMFQSLSKELVPPPKNSIPSTSANPGPVVIQGQQFQAQQVPAKEEQQAEPNLENAEAFLLDDNDQLDDQNLLELVENIEKQNANLQLVAPAPPPNPQPGNAVANVNTTNNNNIVQNLQNPNNPMPYLFFPNSNVTINYNFSK